MTTAPSRPSAGYTFNPAPEWPPVPEGWKPIVEALAIRGWTSPCRCGRTRR